MRRWNIEKFIAASVITGAFALFSAPLAQADDLVTFDFGSAAGNETTSNANFVATGITAPVTISRGTGLTAVANGGRFNAQGWGESSAANALANGDYFEWTITPDGGSSISITQIAFNIQRSNTGASNLVLRTSADGFVADLATLTDFAGNNATVRSTNDTSGVAGLQGLTSSVTMRVIGWTGAGTGSMGFEGTGNDIVISGDVSAGPPTTNVRFTASSDSVSEGAGTYTVTIVKTLAEGNVSGTVKLGGSAALSTDYSIDTTNFTMNGATTSATFTITITDDGDIEGDETVTLEIENVVGAGTVAPSAFTLTITDNDTPPPPAAGIVSFRFTGGSLDATTKDAAISVTPVSLTSGTIETNADSGSYFPDEPYIEESGGWNKTTQVEAKAFQFTITPDVGASVTITAISFRVYATSAGPSAYGYDIGGLATFADDMPATNLLEVNNAVLGVNNQTNSILIQIQGWTNGTRVTSGGGVFRLDDVVVYGTVDTGGGSGYTPEQEAYIIQYWGDVGSYPGDAVDSDGDGYSNVEEYIAGTDPVPPNGDQSFFEATAISSGGSRNVTVLSATGRIYRLWSSSTLAPTQDWQPVGIPLPGNGGNLSLGDASVTNTMSYRVTVELEPVP